MDPARLRIATQSEHRSLEAELDLLRPSLTREDYAELLAHFHAFFRLWEPEAESVIEPALPGFFEARKKMFWLEADLSALNYRLDASCRRAARANTPRLDSVARALGSMYVIEGSTLGGQILAKHFRHRFGFDCNSGCSFFSGYGERTSEMWRAFKEVLADRQASEDEEMIDSALVTFRAMRSCLVSGPLN
jgi:heme oxygenase